MALPLPNGFSGFRVLDEGYHLIDPRASLPKLTSSSRVIKDGTPLILDATGYIDAAAKQGTNEEQRVNITNGGNVPTTGSFYLAWVPPGLDADGNAIASVSIGPIPYNATVAQVQALVDAAVGGGNITVALVAGGGTSWPTALTYYSFTFVGKYSAKNVAAMTVGANTMDQTGTPVIATQTAGVAGYVTSTSFVGFSHDWDLYGAAVNYERMFPLPPNLESPPGSAKRYLFSRALLGRRFAGKYDPNYAVTQALIGDSVDIGYNVTDDQHYVSAGASNALVKIVEIPIESIGKYGGEVIFTVLSAAIAQL